MGMPSSVTWQCWSGVRSLLLPCGTATADQRLLGLCSALQYSS